MTRRFPLAPALAAAFLVGACADVRQSLGLDIRPPDEFKVVSRAPLAIPESLDDLPALRPGAPRPQEIQPVAQAQTALFGDALPEGRSGEGEKVLVAAAIGHALTTTGHLVVGSDVEVRPDIRARIDAEHRFILDDATWIEEINPVTDYGDPTEVVVDAVKERQRLQTAAALGLPPNEGDFESYVVPHEEKALLQGVVEDLF